jgi:hypothetical protein
MPLIVNVAMIGMIVLLYCDVAMRCGARRRMAQRGGAARRGVRRGEALRRAALKISFLHLEILPIS